jgi:hypothetical protein
VDSALVRIFAQAPLRRKRNVMNRYSVSLLAGGLIVLATFAYAQDAPPLKVHKFGDLSYVSGGIDPQERKALGKMAERYQVQLSFKLEGSEEKPKGVKVSMIDYKGDKAIEAVSEGPIFFVNPPAGRWTIQAEYAGQTFTKTVDVNGRFYITVDVNFKPESQTN